MNRSLTNFIPRAALLTSTSMRPCRSSAPLHEPAHVVLDRHVGLHGADRPGERSALARDLLGLAEVARRADHHVGAGAGIGERDRATDPAAPAGDDRHLTAQIGGHTRRAIPRMCGIRGTGGPGLKENRSQLSTLKPAASISLTACPGPYGTPRPCAARAWRPRRAGAARHFGRARRRARRTGARRPGGCTAMELGQRPRRVGDRTEHERRDRGVHGLPLGRERRGDAAHDVHGYGRAACVVDRRVAQHGLGLDRQHVRHRLGIEAEVDPATGAELEDVAAQAVEERTSVLALALVQAA